MSVNAGSMPSKPTKKLKFHKDKQKQLQKVSFTIPELLHIEYLKMN